MRSIMDQILLVKYTWFSDPFPFWKIDYVVSSEKLSNLAQPDADKKKIQKKYFTVTNFLYS